jgi:hypothetical protein
MPTSRIIYNQEALFCGASPATGFHYSSGTSGANRIKQLHRVQSVDYSFNIDRLDVNEFSVLSRIDQIIINPPTVDLNFNYLLHSVDNEETFGLTVNQGVSCISGFLSKAEDDRNFFVSIAPQGQDNANFAGTRSVYGFGNGFVSSYNAEGAVGGLPTASVGVTAFNFRAYNIETGASPAINPTNGVPVTNAPFALPVATTGYANAITALRPGDIDFSLEGINTIGVDPVDLKLQSFSLGVDLAREDIQKLGSLYPASKEITFPVNVTFSAEAIVGDTKTGSLNDILCNDGLFNLRVALRNPACAPAVGTTGIVYDVKGAKISSESFSSSIGPNKTVSFEFSAQIGAAQDVAKGLFISGQRYAS